MDMKFRTWNVRSLYRSGSLKTVEKELGKYKLDLPGVQEVRWKESATERTDGCIFCMEKGTRIIS
jgi:exonuclease III